MKEGALTDPHKEQEVIPLGREERFAVTGGLALWDEQDLWGREGSTSIITQPHICREGFRFEKRRIWG